MEHSKAPIGFLGALVLGAAFIGTTAVVNAHDGKRHDAAPPPAEVASAPETVDVTLYDESLFDQDGRGVKLVTDVIADRIVVMDFIYTSCTTVCPVASAIFQIVQDKLGDRLGRDVVMVSVSVDPSTDTPARLKAYSRKFRAQPGWTFLTGGEHVVDKVLEGLGTYSQDFTAHPNITLIGDGRTGKWTRMYGFANPNHIVAQVDRLVAARNAVLSVAAGSQ